MQAETTTDAQIRESDLANEMRSGGVLIEPAVAENSMLEESRSASRVEEAVLKEAELMAEAAKLASVVEVKPLRADAGDVDAAASGAGDDVGDGVPQQPVPIPPPTSGYVIVGEIARGPRAGQVFALVDLVVLGEWQSDGHDTRMAHRATPVYRDVNAAHLDRERIVGLQLAKLPTCFDVVPRLTVREFRGFSPADRYGHSLVVFGSEAIAAPEWMAYTVGVHDAGDAASAADAAVAGGGIVEAIAKGQMQANTQGQTQGQAHAQPNVIG
jgi:hypothetical protein